MKVYQSLQFISESGTRCGFLLPCSLTVNDLNNKQFALQYRVFITSEHRIFWEILYFFIYINNLL